VTNAYAHNPPPESETSTCKKFLAHMGCLTGLFDIHRGLPGLKQEELALGKGGAREVNSFFGSELGSCSHDDLLERKFFL
jgi:hypothetical protein